MIFLENLIKLVVDLLHVKVGLKISIKLSLSTKIKKIISSIIWIKLILKLLIIKLFVPSSMVIIKVFNHKNSIGLNLQSKK